MGVDREDYGFVYELILEAVNNMLSILCGLNGHIPPGKIKGINLRLAKMAHKPDDMAQRITHFYHDSQQLPDPAPVLGTSFDIADVHVHDLKPGQRPIVVNSRNWYGKLESLYIRLTSIGTATYIR